MLDARPNTGPWPSFAEVDMRVALRDLEEALKLVRETHAAFLALPVEE